MQPRDRIAELTPLVVRLLGVPDPLRPGAVSAPFVAARAAPRIDNVPAPRSERSDAVDPLTWRPLGVTLATVWTRVSQVVEQEIRRRLPANDALGQATAGSSPGVQSRAGQVPDAPPIAVTDRLVSQLMTRMRALAREERFRAGHLR